MARQRSPDRDKAFEIYRKHGGKITNREIAKQLDIPEKSVGGWKCKDKWEEKLNGVLQKNERSTPKEDKHPSKKRGAPFGSKNAVGNKGGAAPKGNQNAVKYGFFSKHLPEDVFEVIQEIEEKDPIDLLWENIVIQYAAIIRAQRIMYVKDQDDITKHLKKKKDGDTFEEREWEFQYAWDKQANFLKAQSRAMDTLQNMMKRYDELLKSDLATEEQRLRVQKLKAEIEKIKEPGDKDKPINITIVRKGEGK